MRRDNDFYPTPEWATNILLDHVCCTGDLAVECCSGDGAIVKPLEARGRFKHIITNDIDVAQPSDYHYDAAGGSWGYAAEADWVISNPPFNVAPAIIPLAYETACWGIAMLLRLSYLEPCKDRGPWLTAHPVSTLIILPRISFTGNGKTDNVTCAWMVWDKGDNRQRVVVAKNPKFEGLY